MAQKPETKFRKKFTAMLDKIPGLWWESIQQKAKRGTPDILACYKGDFVAFELKATPQDEATVLQKKKLADITAARGVAFVVHPGNVEQVIACLVSPNMHWGK